MAGHHAAAAPAVPFSSGRRQSAPGDAVRAEQIRLLYGTPFVWLINLVTGAVTAWLLWPVLPSWTILSWYGALAIVVAARLILWMQYQRDGAAAEHTERWAGAFVLGTFATGCVWGLLAATIFATNDPVYHVFVAFVLGGMTAGAALRDSAYLQAFYAFTAPAFLPLIGALLIQTADLNYEMAAMLAAFTAVLAMMGRANNRNTVDNIRLRLEQDTLIGNLEEMGTNLKRHIREREEVAAALAESNERLRGISENAQDAIFVVDAESNISYWNPAAERIFGYSADDVLGHSFPTLLTPERYRAAVIKAYAEFARTGLGLTTDRTVNFTALGKGEREFPIELSISAMRIGGGWHALGIARDITERHAAEEALREREADLKEAQRLAHVGSWVRQVNPDVLKWSEELYRILDIAPGKQPPRLDDLSHLMDNESRERFRGALVACLADGKPFVIDLQLKRRSGARLWASVQGEAVRDADGTVTALRGTVQDITERKTAEEDIARLHRQMAENVKALERRDSQMRAIARMSDLLQACHSRDEAFPIIAATIETLFPHANGALSLVSAGTRHLTTVRQWGAEQTSCESFTFDDCWALRTGRRYDLSGPGEGTPCQHFETLPSGPSICLPLMVQGETIGLLHMDCTPGSALDEEKQNLMTSIADVIKLSLSNLRMREILSDQAVRDQLTTLYNRRYLAETLPREIRRAERDKLPLAIALIDVDHFKGLNDTFGHDAGDTVLRNLGELLRRLMRRSDIACRYGGEEFLLVLPECTQDDAVPLVQTICDEIKHLSLTVHGTPLPAITVSAGIAEIGSDIQTAEGLISSADSALYAAKKNGRNRIELFSATTPRPAKARHA